MRIAICDDDFSVLDLLEYFIRQYFDEYNIDLVLERFSNGTKLLTGENVREAYDCLFMDIYFDSDGSLPTGTDIVRRLNLSKNTQVVFMTTSREHAIEAFSLNAVHYLVKPLTYPAVSEALSRCIDRLGGDVPVKMLEIKTKRDTISVPEDSIIYIEVSNKQSTVHTAKTSFETYASLDSIFELLDKSTFIRAQRSYIVNMRYIDEFLSDRLILTDKTEVMLSRSLRRTLKQQYKKYLFDLARRGGDI